MPDMARSYLSRSILILSKWDHRNPRADEEASIEFNPLRRIFWYGSSLSRTSLTVCVAGDLCAGWGPTSNTTSALRALLSACENNTGFVKFSLQYVSSSFQSLCSSTGIPSFTLEYQTQRLCS
jgi:hypothetical protein